MLILSYVLIALKRLRSRLGLTLLLLLSTTLTVGLIACIPIFAGAVSLRIMEQELAARAAGRSQPSLSVRVYAMGSASRPVTLADADQYGAWLQDLLERELDMPTESLYRIAESPTYSLVPAQGSGAYTKPLGSVHIAWVDRLADHVTVEGHPIGGTGDGQVLDVWVERHYADELALQLGEQYRLDRSFTPHLDDLEVRVAGFWEPRDASDRWWYLDPTAQFRAALLTTREQYEQHLYPRVRQGTAFTGWYFVYPDRRVNLARAEHYIAALERASRLVGERLPSGSMDHSPTEALRQGFERKQALSLVLLGFSVPVVVILIYFISVLSTLMVRFQQQEIAMFASRGSSRIQITLLTLIETLLVLMVATPLGLMLSLSLARLLGDAQGFMRFVPRQPLPVYLVSLDWCLVAGAVGLTVVSRLVPAWAAARRTIVQQEQARARRQVVVGMTRLLLTAFLGAATWYAYRQLARIGTLALVSWQPGDAQHDPLLLLAPSLFLLTAPLLASELFVWLARPLAWGARWLHSVAAYLGLTDLGREGGQYRTPIYMLILCLSLGVFYASLAKSADAWLLDRRQYQVGSDLTFTTEIDSNLEKFGLTKAEINEVLGSPSNLPIETYEAIEEVRSAMPLGEYRGAFRAGRSFTRFRLLAIDRLRFPVVAYYRRDYAADALGTLMNQLGAVENGVLLPTAFLQQYQLAVGDTIKADLTVDEDTSHALELVIVGSFDYFPTWTEQEEPLWVVNLSYIDLQTSNMLPYGIWMRLEPDATAHQVLQVVRDQYRLKTGMVHDLALEVGGDQLKLERVGIFGLLSVCFVAGALLAALGLLVHSAAAMKGRSLRFAVLQALGMARRTLLSTLLIEYLVVVGYGIAAGLGLGLLTSQLYGPFFQLTDLRTVPIPPYLPLVDQTRAAWLALGMGVVLLGIELGLLVTLWRTRVFEALRLGMKE